MFYPLTCCSINLLTKNASTSATVYITIYITIYIEKHDYHIEGLYLSQKLYVSQIISASQKLGIYYRVMIRFCRLKQKCILSITMTR